MKIERSLSLYTHDVRYASGQLLLNRVANEHGVYVQNGSSINCYSRAGDEAGMPDSRDLMEIAQAANQAHGPHEIQLVRTIKIRQVSGADKQVQDWLYYRINGGMAKLVPYGKTSEMLLLMSDSMKEEAYYHHLPLYTENFEYDQIVVSHSVFGHFLHESLGHRLESDDYSMPVAWGPMPHLNFSVYDCPGDESMSGHTPFDDYGVIGREVCLFDPTNGRSELLSFETGNARATHYMNHPLVRQRCLDVRVLFPIASPICGERLHLDEVDLASYSEGETVINVSRARLVKNGKQYRLPAIELSFSDEDILRFCAFGEKKLIEPAGGCHKSLQRGLNVSYNSTQAFLQVKGEITI